MKKLLLSILTITALGANAQWAQIGTDIDGEVAGDESGWSVSLSDDGSIVAIGARENDGSFTNAGHVRIYKNTSGTWTQVGTDINGEAAGDYSGYAVDLSSDGSIVAIGAAGNDAGGSNRGHVRIYKNVNGTWTQIGADIDGEASSDESGSSVSLSNDGSIVAIAARNNDGSFANAGHVRIYKNISGTWTQIGADIDGEASADYSGYDVSLSGDGSIVAIGAAGNDGSGGVGNYGQVRVYENISGSWTQIYTDIDGEATSDESGSSVSLSDDGSIVAIAAIKNDGNGADAGHVRVYEYSVTTSINKISTQNISIYPNPATSQITLNTTEQIENISIIDITGKIVKIVVLTNNTIDVSNLRKGLYFLQVQTKNGIVNSKFIKE